MSRSFSREPNSMLTRSVAGARLDAHRSAAGPGEASPATPAAAQARKVHSPTSEHAPPGLHLARA
jgi:hypothetical protein